MQNAVTVAARSWHPVQPTTDEAAMRAQNPAHHVDDKGDTECYGRADAAFLLTMAAAVVT